MFLKQVVFDEPTKLAGLRINSTDENGRVSAFRVYYKDENGEEFYARDRSRNKVRAISKKIIQLNERGLIDHEIEAYIIIKAIFATIFRASQSFLNPKSVIIVIACFSIEC